MGGWERVTCKKRLASHLRWRRQCLGNELVSLEMSELAILPQWTSMLGFRLAQSMVTMRLFGFECLVALRGPCLTGVGGWVGLGCVPNGLVLGVCGGWVD